MSEFGDAATATPEINHTLMISGDLGESLIQAAAAYEALADMLMAELTAMGLNTTTTATVGWLGPGGVMMQMSAAEFMAVCAAASAWVRIAQTQAGEVAAAHSTALGSMIPAEVCATNRATQAGLISTNFIGQNTPAIVALEEQYIQYWITNATARTGFGSVVSAALGAISEPGPLSPTAANPAGPLAAAAQAAGQDGAQAGLQTSAKTLTQAADTPVKEASNPAEMMSSLAGQAGGLFGQVGSAFGQVASTGQQLPSMLGQAPQMFSGLLGPLSSSMSGMNGAQLGALAPEAAAAGGVPMSVGGLGALAGGGGGGGGLMSGSSALSTTFVRPASSFSSPTAPTLPGGWQGSPESAAASQARPAGMGGGGLYGAPAAMGGEASSGTEKSTRTMQVTARPGVNRRARQRI